MKKRLLSPSGCTVLLFLYSLIMCLVFMFIGGNHLDVQEVHQLSLTSVQNPGANMSKLGGWEECNLRNRVLLRGSLPRPSNLQQVNFSLELLDSTAVQDRRQKCSSLDDLLTAIRHGTRQHDDQGGKSQGDIPENSGSWFKSFRCAIPFLMSNDFHTKAHQFGKIVMVGDSLARHIHMGFHVMFSNDLVHAGWDIMKNRDNNKLCYCDGLFSENDACRALSWMFETAGPNVRLVEAMNPRGEKLHRLKRYDFRDVHCLWNHSRPLLLVLQGGLHWNADPYETVNKLLPILEHRKVQECSQASKLFLIWTSFTSVTNEVARKYPHQSRSNGTRFNKVMARYFSSKQFRNVAVIEWMNLTDGAASSDGVHHLLDTNVFKAQHIIQVGDALMNEGRTATLPDKSRLRELAEQLQNVQPS